MDSGSVTDMIGALGFPIFLSLVLIVFIYKIYEQYRLDTNATMERLRQSIDRFADSFETIAKSLASISTGLEKLEDIDEKRLEHHTRVEKALEKAARNQEITIELISKIIKDNA